MIIADKDGTIYLYQGDSGELVFKGLDCSKPYKVCLAIHNKDGILVGEELTVNTNNSDVAVFVLTADFTDLLRVPKKRPFEVYYYGIKTCVMDTGEEDTLFIANNTYGDMNRIVVYPRKVSGNIYG